MVCWNMLYSFNVGYYGACKSVINNVVSVPGTM